MVRTSPNLNDGSGGEYAPLLEGRQDIERYAAGRRILENFLPTSVGPLVRRPGTNFVASTRYPDRVAVLLPFQYSIEQAYMLEFGDLYVRFYRNDGPLLEAAKAISGATAANPVVLTVNAHGWSNGDDFEASGVLGMTQLNGRRFRVANKTTNTVELHDQHDNPIDGTGYSAYVSGGSASRVYTLTTTYQEQDLTGLKIAQSVDTLYITHQEYVPRKLQRYGATNWLLSQIDFLDGPYLPTNTSQATLTPAAATGAGISIANSLSQSVTGMANNGSGGIRVTVANHGWKSGDRVEISGTVGTTEANTTTDNPWTVTRITANTFDLNGSVFVNAWSSGGTVKPFIFTTTDVGRLLRIAQSSTWGWAKIVTVTNAHAVTADIFSSVGTSATASWRLGLYSTGGGYPTCVTIYEGRLFLGGCPITPTRIDGSIAQDSAGVNYETFSPTRTDGTVTDAEALQYPLDSGDVNNVLWMKDDEKGLLVGTLGGEWLLRSNALGDALTPTNVKAVRGTTYGSYANSQPVRTGSDVIYVQRKQRKLRNLNYTYTTDGFQAGDLTLLSPHISATGIGQIAYQAEPQGWVWGVRGDGQAAVVGYDRDEGKIGWSRQIFGGYQDAARLRPAALESVAVIPSPDDDRDEVWCIVRRTINGQTERYVEFTSGQWEIGDDQEQADYVDCSLKFDGSQLVTLQPGAGADVDGTIGVTFSAGSSVFISSDPGRFITVRYFDYSETDPENPSQLGKWKTAKAKITGYTSATVVTATIQSAFPSLDQIASGGWRLSAEALSNLWHLEGETITINAEGATHPDVVVTNGTAQLAEGRGCGYAVAGLKCPARLQTMRVEAGGMDGTSQGKIKRVISIIVRFVQSLGTEVGPTFSDADMKPVQYRTSATPMGQPPQIADGDSQSLPWSKGFETDGRLALRNESPFPCTVVALLPQVETYPKN